jgi:hypothetical protein
MVSYTDALEASEPGGPEGELNFMVRHVFLIGYINAER